MAGEGVTKTARWTFYTAGGLMIFMGVFSLLHPMVALVSTAVLLGVGFIIAGLNSLVPYFTIKDPAIRPKWLLPLGIVDLAFGLIFISHIGLAVFTVTTLLGVWVGLAGALRLYIAFQLKSAGVAKWWIMLASGALMLIAAFLLLTNPIVAAIGVAMITGASLIGAGCLMIAEGRILYPPQARQRTK